MEIEFSDEQRQLQDQVRRMLSDTVTADRLRALITDGSGFDPGVWSKVCDLGLPGVAIPAEYGGVGLGPKDLCAISEEMGRAVTPVPFFSSVCLAAEAIKLTGTAAQKARWLPLLASGEAIGTFAWSEGRGAPGALATRLSGGAITGAKWPVPDAALAHVAVVVCDGPVLALVELGGAGISQTPLDGFDLLRRHARVTFDGAPAEAMDALPADEALERLYRRAAVFEAFEQIGAAESALYMARDYTLQRYTFGRQLASYQAVKHNLANILVMIELARANALAAATALESGAPDAPVAAATARIAATRAYETAARENLQLHGGIGYTWEADCHFHYRRARLLALNLGSPEVWEARLIDALSQSNLAA